MKLVFTWEEFTRAAVERLCEKHADLRGSNGKPVFMSKGDYYEPDSEAFNFPPAYVEFEV